MIQTVFERLRGFFPKKQQLSIPLQTPMNEFDYLLSCLSEEAGEIIQVLGKIARFGMYDKNPNNGEINIDLLEKEVHDLLAVYRMLDPFLKEKRLVLRQELIQNKTERVQHFMEDSVAKGRLIPSGVYVLIKEELKFEE